MVQRSMAFGSVSRNGIVGTMPIWKPELKTSSGQPIYRAIVQALADDIARGLLAKGTRLPPHRDLADALGVARGTIAKAYREAERLGLVRGDVGRGTCVLAPDSGTRPYATLLEAPTVPSDLTTNYPMIGIDPDPSEALRELASRPDRRALLRYQSNLGLHRHRLAGVRWAERYGVATCADDVIVCSGAQHALFVALAHLVKPGDAVLVEEWGYPGLFGIAETLRIRLVPVAMDRAGLLPESLDRACRQRRVRALCTMPTVHNPLGIVLSMARRKQIVKIARRHNLCIIEDEAHRLLALSPPPPLCTLAPERTYFVASTSKILGAGLRVAFLVAPPGQADQLAKHIWATQWMVSPLGAEIVAIWLERGVADQTLKRKRREAAQRQRLARSLFAAYRLAGHPNALHLWLELPPHWRSDALTAEALRQGLGVTPATAFWMRASPPCDAIRIALGGVNDRGELRRQLSRLAKLIRSKPKLK